MSAEKRDTTAGFTPAVQPTADVVARSYDCRRLDGQLERGVLSPAIHNVLLGVARLRNSVSSFRLEGERVELDRARRLLDGTKPETATEAGVPRLARE